MRRYITLPNGKRCSIPMYVKAWRLLLTLPPQEPISGFSWWTESAADVLREIRAGMHDRINRHDPAYGVGRKWSPDWQRAAGHCARAVNTPRLIVRQIHPADLRARLSHRLEAA